MPTYQWILFDADETLFRFDAFTGLKLMFFHLGVKFTQPDYEQYQTLNKALWVEYQNGNISAQQLQQRRFDAWSVKLQLPAQELNSAFLAAMATTCTPLIGAKNLLTALQGRVKLGIITNGFTELQQVRLERSGFQHFFDILVISEQVGSAKPQRAIFDHALEKMGNPERDRVLMVGDNPDTDILGGINAGLHTCWLNSDRQPTPATIQPHHQVASLAELEQWLLPHFSG